MNSQSNQGEGKKLYEPPKVTTISLRPEEAVLGHCKTTTSGSFGFGSCQPLGICNSIGS